MTIIKENETNGRITIMIIGHAGYSKSPDPVCAAASILMYTMVENFKHDAQVEFKEDMPMAMFVFERSVKNIEKYKIIRKGYELLQEAYPENVRIESEIFYKKDKDKGRNKKNHM